MEKQYIRKTFDLKALDIDTAKRQVKIAIGETETKDRDGDIILPTAANRTIKAKGPQGTNEIWHLLDHTSNSFSALSKFSEMGMYGKYIGGISKYKNSFAWREVAWPIYEAGEATQHSIGFKTIDQEKQKDGINVIKEIELYEGSLVLWGANPNTPTLQVVKSLLKSEDDREITAQEKLAEIITRLKKGKYSDEKAELLLVEMYRLQNMLESEPLHKIITNELQEKSTEPASKDAPRPDAADELLVLVTLKQKHLNLI